MKSITVCLASCNRFDLLKQTIDSFFYLNTSPVGRFIITEDSADKEMQERVLKTYHNQVMDSKGTTIEVVINKKNLGPYKTFDNMYNMVDTPYIFHCEDDWHFKGNPNFLTESADILEERKDIHQIWIRHGIRDDFFEPLVQKTKTGIDYRMVKINHLNEWSGFSGNPSLKRLEDYKKMFPKGYSDFVVPGVYAGEAEYLCNIHAKNQGYRAATLTYQAITHLGHGRSTIL